MAGKKKNKLQIPKNTIKVLKASTMNSFLLHILPMLIPQRCLKLKQIKTRTKSNIIILWLTEYLPQKTTTLPRKGFSWLTFPQLWLAQCCMLFTMLGKLNEKRPNGISFKMEVNYFLLIFYIYEFQNILFKTCGCIF